MSHSQEQYATLHADPNGEGGREQGDRSHHGGSVHSVQQDLAAAMAPMGSKELEVYDTPGATRPVGG
jgi:hypothetical protein